MCRNIIKDSKIFITGGAGFVGSHLVEELLLLKPKKIYILDNLLRGTYENMSNFINNPLVEFRKGDINEVKLVDEYMSKSDFCFHLATLRINACAADPVEGYEVMVKGTFDILESARKYKIRKIIYSSSASVYGMAQNFPTPETENPYDNRTFYGAAKLFGEQLLKCYCHMYGLNYIALRYFNIYGPRMDREGKYTEVMIKWLDCIRKGKPPLIYGDGDTTMDFVYVKDIAKANVLALLSDITNEAFNIACHRETSLKELLQILLKVNNSTLVPQFMPESTVNPVKRRWADISKAKRMLDYEPSVNLEDGLRLLSEWYFENTVRG
ncbi:MAG: NAD-dependent epimerase/dehydratase family protein [Candidatus Omnitrophota bacterium]